MQDTLLSMMTHEEEPSPDRYSVLAPLLLGRNYCFGLFNKHEGNI